MAVSAGRVRAAGGALPTISCPECGVPTIARDDGFLCPDCVGDVRLARASKRT